MAGRAGSLLIDIAADVSKLRQDMGEAKQTVSDFSAAVTAVGAVIAGAFAAYQVISRFIGYVQEVSRVVAELGDRARQLDLSAQQFQAYVEAMRAGGTSLNEATSILQRGFSTIGNAIQGNKNAAKTLADLGVEMRDQAGNIKTYGELLPEVARAILAIEDPMQRAAVATRIFGRNAREVLPALEELGKGAEVLQEQYQRMIIPDDVVRRFTELRNTFGEMNRGIAVDVAKTIDVMANAGGTTQGWQDLSEAVLRLSKALADLVANGAGQSVAEMLGNLVRVLTAVTNGISALIEMVNSVIGALKQIPGVAEGAKAALQNMLPGLSTLMSTYDAVRNMTGASRAQARQGGGPVRPGEVYIVGERGPEIFVPNVAGLVLPNHQTLDTATDRTSEQIERLQALRQSFEDLNGSIANTCEVHDELDASQRRTVESVQTMNDALQGSVAGLDMYADRVGRASSQIDQSQRAFQRSADLIGSAISGFVKTGELDFGRLAQSFAQMLADMAMQWAMSSIKDVLGSSLFGGGGGGGGLLGGIFGGLIGRMAGGPVAPGVPYRVGEAGPEMFIPQVAGTIVPNSQTAAVARGDNITVNLTMGTTDGASDPQSSLEFGRRLKAAIVDVIANEKRPGGSLYARRNA